ncbi:MAG: ComEC/Rec2 family competence protein [Armatimonadetes bacterium]|nr:ComEC/Rec2 family competence protein [Armatimonadota bacterium]
MRLQPLPLFTVAFAAGVALSGAGLSPPRPLLGAAAAAGFVALAALRAAPRLALPALGALALAAGAFAEANDRAGHPNVLAAWAHHRVTLVGQVLQEPRATCTGSWLYRARAAEVRHRGEATAVDALFLLRTDAGPLAPGTWFEASGFLRPIRGFANFGATSNERYLAPQHLHAQLYARSAFLRPIPRADVRWDRRLAWRLRERLLAAHHAALAPDDAALLNSLVFGTRAAAVPEALERDFRDAGITHLLVASGAQVSLIVLALLPMLRWLWLPRWLYVGIAFAAAWLYGLMAGGGPSILRAGAMSVALTAGLVLGRKSDPLSLLSLAALGILALDPPALFDIGFQLSFAAVWGLLHLTSPIAKLLPPRPRWIWQRLPERHRRFWLVVPASIAAQLATAPVIAHWFCRAAPVGVLANLAAVPLAGLLLAGGLAGALAGLVSPAAAWALDTVNLPLLALLRAVARGCAGIPGGHVWVVPPNGLQVALCFGALGLLPRLIRWLGGRVVGWTAGVSAADDSAVRALDSPTTRPPNHRATALALSLVLAATLAAWRMAPRQRVLRVTFLDVGHGDSALVQAPSGATLLVDGGGSEQEACRLGERVLLPALLHRGARRLDYVVATHPHADHTEGLAEACRDLPVGALVVSGLHAGAPDMARLLDAARRQSVPVLRARAGTSWLLDPDTRITVLSPPEGAPERDGDDAENESSLVLRVDFGQVSFLLTGDIGAATEERLRASGAPLRAMVLKVAHHGSGGSSSEAFLDAVAPRLAVISVGQESRYDLPHPAAVKRALGRSVLLFRTDEDGAVEVRTDGNRLMVRAARWGSGSVVALRARDETD